LNELDLVGSFWPSRQQKLLLRAALNTDESAARAWRELRPQFDLDRLEPGSFPLLPLLHRRLERLGIDDPYIPRLAGISRRTWYLNQLRLNALARALGVLEEVAAEPIVVCGWEIPAHYYGGDFSLRPVDALNVLVRSDRIDASVRVLAEAGWIAGRRAPGGQMRLVNTAGCICIVDTRVAREFSVPERGIEVADVWAETIDISLGNIRARALSPSDELLRVCVHGARASAFPNVVWLADALAVLRADETAVDWQRILRQTLRLRAMLRLRDALVYLRRELNTAVPDSLIQELEATPPRWRETLAHKQAGRSARLVAARFLQVTSDRTLPLAATAAATFLRDELGLKRRTDVPLEVARRAAMRVRNRPAGAMQRPRVGAE
jgi:Uncharacterised nucleotidyltransferase